MKQVDDVQKLPEVQLMGLLFTFIKGGNVKGGIDSISRQCTEKGMELISGSEEESNVLC